MEGGRTPVVVTTEETVKEASEKSASTVGVERGAQAARTRDLHQQVDVVRVVEDGAEQPNHVGVLGALEQSS